jgi:DNA-binding MarR family transcriptional regulator
MEAKTAPAPPEALGAPLGRLGAAQALADALPGDIASQAWMLIHRLMIGNKARFVAIGAELGLSPQQAIALRMLVEPRTMGQLAQALACDSSNVTGIVDRLEDRGFVERRSAEGDRRKKLIVLTEAGERMRGEVSRRIAVAPPQIAALSKADQRTLRDLMRKAIEAEG